ncbi:hypothetical protein [Asticcacaulis benevestitus]|uniref:hypothetical protein n=1 Tax=Asticcacaulis benevestitus TaxID=347481 RepID=UPI0012DE5ABA|nr:hypothetical protein [Asticcacaulis benevestitus]
MSLYLAFTAYPFCSDFDVVFSCRILCVALISPRCFDGGLLFGLVGVHVWRFGIVPADPVALIVNLCLVLIALV